MQSLGSSFIPADPLVAADMPAPVVAVLGSAFLDYVFDATSGTPIGPPRYGGVGRNVAENLGWLGVGVILFTLLSSDDLGRNMAAHLCRAGVCVAAIDAAGGVGRFIGEIGVNGEVRRREIVQPPLDLFDWSFIEPRLANDIHYLVTETGLPTDTVEHALDYAAQHDIISVALLTRFDQVGPRWELLRRFRCVILNAGEAARLLGVPVDSMAAALDTACHLNAAGIRWAVVTCGAEGVALGVDGVARFYPAPQTRVVTTIGAGDAFAAGFVAGIAVHGTLDGAIRVGLAMARRTVEVAEAVRGGACRDLLMPHQANLPAEPR
ncbi:carbohydrate kinase family protein [Sorangium sp. So ce1128]